MSPNISRPEKMQQRKLHVLRTAQSLAREHGYLTLNVAEVAKESEVSIGTLYSHFQNKEGLVAALAVHSLKGRVATFEAVRKNDKLNLDEQLLLIVFADFLFSLDHPELLAAEQLGSSTAILREMPGGLFQWISKNELNKISPVQLIAEHAISKGLFTPWKNQKKHATAIDRGIWTLVAGSSYIWNVMELNRNGNDEPRIPDWLKKNVTALFVGYGWKSKQPEKDIERLARLSLKSFRMLATDCKV